MSKVTYSLGVSLDGFAVGPDGSIDWGFPDREVFDLATDEVRGLGVHLMGRRLYEAMLVWETIDQDPALDHSTAEFAELWRALPKVVFSRTLKAVEGNARLASGGIADEIARWRTELDDDVDIAIGGPTLAAEAATLGLIDEYRLRVFPVLLGGGTPYFARHEQQVDLDLLESRTLASRVLYLRYGVVTSG